MEGTVMGVPWRIIDSLAPEAQTKIKIKITLGKEKSLLEMMLPTFFPYQ